MAPAAKCPTLAARAAPKKIPYYALLFGRQRQKNSLSTRSQPQQNSLSTCMLLASLHVPAFCYLYMYCHVFPEPSYGYMFIHHVATYVHACTCMPSCTDTMTLCTCITSCMYRSKWTDEWTTHDGPRSSSQVSGYKFDICFGSPFEPHQPAVSLRSVLPRARRRCAARVR